MVLVGALSHSVPQNKVSAPEIESMARSVTIYRDTYGVPHIYGPTDASVIFGLAYARAEDQFWRIEQNYLGVLGRMAEVAGEAGLASDLLAHALEVERWAKAEYERSSPEVRAIAEAYVNGINYYLATHPEERPRVLARFEPWYPFASERYFQLSQVGPAGVQLEEVVSFLLPARAASDSRGPWPTALAGAMTPFAMPPAGDRLCQLAARRGSFACPADAALAETGSNMWAAGPSKSATGRALLFQNPPHAVRDAVQSRSSQRSRLARLRHRHRRRRHGADDRAHSGIWLEHHGELSRHRRSLRRDVRRPRPGRWRTATAMATVWPPNGRSRSRCEVRAVWRRGRSGCGRPITGRSWRPVEASRWRCVSRSSKRVA